MATVQNKYLKTTVKRDWPKILAELKRRTGKDYAQYYIREIINGSRPSGVIKPILDEMGVI